MPQQTDPDQFLMGGGVVRSAKFAQYGDTITGQVVETRITQRTDIQTKEPLTWPNGDPKLQLVVTLQTTLREDPDDDGMRNVYVSGSTQPGSRSMHAAVADAVRAAGAETLEVGGVLSVTYDSEEASSTPGFMFKKYRAHFQRPNPSAAAGAFLGTTTPQDQPAYQPPQQPPQQPPAYLQQPPQQQPPMPNGWQPQGSGPSWAQPPQPPQQQPVPAAASGPSTEDIERFNAWKASQGQQG